MILCDRRWNPVYESGFSSNSLTDAFYRPFLSEVERYDRLAGYLSLRSLAHALEGIDSMLETGGKIRVIAGADLQERERGAMFPDADEPLAPWVESQLTIIATLLDRGDLQIKVGDPKSGEGLFHPKLGIGEDANGDILTFEGSINETLSAWQYNYERFKVHRSWERGEEKYVKEDVSTFNALWNGYHPSVDVHELDEADEQDIINWKNTDEPLDEHVERVRQHAPQAALAESDVATAISVAGRAPGGLHLAEDVSTVTPWPHQRTIADTAVSIYPNNLLFCDEVGLGKTIEAGLTLSRLVHTGRVENALFLVPAGLVQQWQDELLGRFNIHAFCYDRSHDGEYLVGPLGDEQEDRVRIEGDATVDGWAGTPIGRFVTERDQPTVVIQSWHTARRDANQRHVAPSEEREVWDLVVVDEAHSGREDTKLHELLGRAEVASSCLYALTATPMQLNVGELYDLLRLCDLPDAWDDKERFMRFFETRRALETSLEKVGGNYRDMHDGQNAVLMKLREELELEEGEGRPRLKSFARLLHEHITAHPGYDEEVPGMIDTASLGLREEKVVQKLLGVRDASSRFDAPESLVFDCGPVGWRALVDVSERATPVQSRIFRNTRTVLEQCKELGLLEDTVPQRSVETKRIELGDAKPLYEKVEEYIETTYEQSQKVLTGKEKLALGFVMTTYRQRLTSSLHAIKQSLRRRETKLDAEVEDLTEEVSALGADTGVTEAAIDEVVGQMSFDAYRPTTGQAASVVRAEREMLREFVDDLDRMHTDPKVAQLRRDIRHLRKRAIDDIIIFTQYQDTLEHIRKTLTDTHPNVGTYSGEGGFQYDPDAGEWMPVGKETIKRSFTSAGGTNILICTDSASEGLNLQTADALINYDLPWNPMRVEQRIGRIDRIGQENEMVEIINYAYKDSVDGDIYEELEERLDLFENVVGPMRPVLNSIESDITKAVMGSDEDERSATDQVAEQADERAAAAREREEETGLATEEEETTTREEIIEGAGLVGWGDSKHPDLSSIGGHERRYEPVVARETIEQLFVHSDRLAETGWSCTALRNHDRAEEFEGTATDAYVLDVPDEDRFERPESMAETAQVALGRSGGLVVTFSPAVADQFPSIRLLLPGDPLFETLLSVTVDEEPHNVELLYGSRHEAGEPEIEIGDEGDLDSVDVVGVGAMDESVTDLPGERTLDSVSVTEQTLRDWLTSE